MMNKTFIQHTKSPVDKTPVVIDGKEIPSRDIMSGITDLFEPRPLKDSFEAEHEGPPEERPPPDASFDRSVGQFPTGVSPRQEAPARASPASTPKRSHVDISDDEEDDRTSKRRHIYIPPPTGTFINQLDSIQFDVPAFGNMDSDMRALWLSKMQQEFSEIHNDHSYIPLITLEDNTVPAYLRRQFIRLKNVSDSTIVENWVYRMRIGLYAVICFLEYATKEWLGLDIGPLAQTSDNKTMKQYYDMALRKFAKKWSNALSGGDLNPWLILAGTCLANLIVSVIIGQITKRFPVSEGQVGGVLETFVNLVMGKPTAANAPSQGPAAPGESAGMPERASGQASMKMFGQDPIDLVKKAAALFSTPGKAGKEPDKKKPRGSAAEKPKKDNTKSAYAF